MTSVKYLGVLTICGALFFNTSANAVKPETLRNLTSILRSSTIRNVFIGALIEKEFHVIEEVKKHISSPRGPRGSSIGEDEYR